MVLRPHQRKAFDSLFDSITLRLDDARPFQWFLSLPHGEKWHLYLAAGLVIPIAAAGVSMYGLNEIIETGRDLTSRDKAQAVLGTWLIAVVILNSLIVIAKFLSQRGLLILMLALGYTAPGWYYGAAVSFSVTFASLLRYAAHGEVYCYPNLLAQGEPPIWIWESGAMAEFGGASLFLYMMLGQVAFLAVIALQILLALLLATAMMAFFTALVRTARALAWRIAEYNSGAFMGLMALLGLALGVLRVVLKTSA